MMGHHLTELLNKVEHKELQKAHDRITSARAAAKAEFQRLGSKEAVEKARDAAKAEYAQLTHDLKIVQEALANHKDKTEKVLSGAAKKSAERKAAQENGAAAPPEQQPQEQEQQEA